MTPAGQVAVIAGVGLAVLHIAKSNAKTVANAVNPASDQNVIYNGINKTVETTTGSEFNLGHWIYDKIHGKKPLP